MSKKLQEVGEEIRHAAKLGKAEDLRRLLNALGPEDLAGAVDQGNEKNGLTPLILASWKGYADCVRVLLEDGKASLDLATRDGFTALHQASQKGHAECVKLLLEANADPNVGNKKGWTPLHLAAENANLQVLTMLLDKGAEINKGNQDDFTALYWAVANNLVPVVGLLLDRGADPDKESKDGESPSFRSAAEGHAVALKMLLAAGANSNGGLRDGETLCHVAADQGRLDCVKLLLQWQADPNVANEDQNTPSHWAARKGHAECLKALIDGGADPNRGNLSDWTPLHTSAEKGFVDCVKVLIEGGADVNQTSKSSTPLFWALRNDHEDCVKLLLRHGADPGSEVLPWVAWRGWSDYLRQLIANGADPNAGDSEGRTAAYRAANHPIDGQDNPCLDILIEDYHCLFLSHYRALLTDREKHIRLGLFAGVGAALCGALYVYLVVGHHLRESCNTAYDGMLLQPYMFEFLDVFAFKVAQVLFEEALFPALDFGMFICWWHCCFGGASNHRRKSRPDFIPAPVPGLPDPAHHEGTLNPLSLAVSPIREMPGDVEMGPRSSVAGSPPGLELKVPPSDPKLQREGAAPGGASFVIPLYSRVLYVFCGEQAVKGWRKHKYLSAHKPFAHYKGEDFWRQTSYYFLYLQFAAAWISIAVAFMHINPSTPAWNGYINFFAIIVNSAVPTAAFSIMKMHTLEKREEQLGALPLWLRAFFWVPFLALAPPFFSHIVPMMFFYCWAAVPILLLLSVGVPLLWDRHVTPLLAGLGLRAAFVDYIVVLLLELSWRFLFVFLFRVLFNWGSLLYLQPPPLTPQAYISVLVQDWQLRSQSECFVRHAIQSSRGSITLFSWL